MNSEWMAKSIKSSCDLAEHMEWNKWMKEMPFISWPDDMEVQAIPPFTGAIVRYRIRIKGSEEVCATPPVASVYLDCYDILGVYGKPYWEVYPVEDDTYRCDMEDVDALINAVRRSLIEQAKELL